MSKTLIVNMFRFAEMKNFISIKYTKESVFYNVHVKYIIIW